MSIKKLFTLSLLTLSFAGLTACDKGSTSPDDEDSSSSVASFRSSSSFSNDRADIDYRGEIVLGDTMRLNIDLFKGDSTDMDSTEIYVDSSETTIPLYLGKLAKGSRIKVLAKTFDLKNDQIRIRSEQGEYLRAVTAVPKKANSKDSVFSNYFVPSFGSDSSKIFRDSNEFVVFNESHYYIELSGEFNDDAVLRLKATVDTAYYNYTGDTKSISMKMTDTIRGVVLMNDSLEDININFSATEGYSINLKSAGKNITKVQLIDGDEVLGSYTGDVDTMLVPNDSVDWSLKVTTEESSFFFLTGPLAFFEVTTKARALEQGEYFAKPDSIQMPGETFTRTRPKDDPNKAIYKYNLRQEQFVWLGDYKKGDSILVKHSISNYSDDKQSPVTIEILDKDQKKQGSVNAVYGGSLKITKDMPEGPYYLHYLRLNSDPLDQVADSMRYVLQLHTLLQQVGSVESMEFTDAEFNTLDAMFKSPGDTIRFKDLTITMEPNKEKGWEDVNYDVTWYIPCEDLVNINTSPKTSCGVSESAREISANYLIVQAGSIGETARLIAESIADPSMRDTLDVIIIAKSAED